jgi:hypothetical protein
MTVIPGADKGGLFADGVVNLPRVDTTDWKTYANAKYGYSFRYPSTWELVESSSEGRTGPRGEPSYPLQSARVRNPGAEQGQNIRGQNCIEAGCIEPPPNFLSIEFAVHSGICGGAGDLLARDTPLINGRQSQRCVVRSAYDRATVAVYVDFPLGPGNYLKAVLTRGRGVTPQQQAVLETVLSTLSFTP